MQLAPIASAPLTVAPAPAIGSAVADRPTDGGLRVSADRAFSAPRFAAGVRPLEATSLASAVKEARELLAAGSFDGLDAARAVALLSDDGASFRAGSLIELRMGRDQQMGVPAVDPNWEYWYEPGVAAVLDAKTLQLAR